MPAKDATNPASTRTANLGSLADVAMIDAFACAAVGGMSVSWWYNEVAAGRAPAPAIRKPRCTRWLVSAVRAFWVARAAPPAANTGADEPTIRLAKKASMAAAAKRNAAGVPA